MTYSRMKGDDGAHMVLQALISTWKPVGHVRVNPWPSIAEYSDARYSNTGYSSSILRPIYSPDRYLFSGSSSINSFSDLPLNPKRLPSGYPSNPKQLSSEYPPNPKQLSSDEYSKIFNVPIVGSLERNPLVSPVPLPSDHGSTNVLQAPVPILKSAEVYVLPSSALLGSGHGSTSVVQAPPPNPASLTANPDAYYPLMPPPMQGSWEGPFK